MMEVGPPTTDLSEQLFFGIQFSQLEWMIVKSAALERTKRRELASPPLKPLLFDSDLMVWDMQETLNCTQDYPDDLCELLEDYGDHTEEAFDTLPASMHVGRQLLGAEAKRIARQLRAEADISASSRDIDTEIALLLGQEQA